MAITAGKQVRKYDRAEADFAYLKGNTKAYAGGIIMLDTSGRALDGAATAGCIGIGVAKTNKGLDRYDATSTGPQGQLGDSVLPVFVEEGIFLLKNYASDLLAAGDEGKPCYIYDNETVAKTSSSGTRPPAGRVFYVATEGVYVLMGKHIARQIAEEILAGDDTYSTTGSVTGFVAGSGTASKSDSVWAGPSGSTAYTVGDVVGALKALGILAA